MGTSSYVCPRCRKPVSFLPAQDSRRIGSVIASEGRDYGLMAAASVWPVHRCNICGQYICNPDMVKVSVLAP
ncbi:hypothetical protein DGWBC_1237 [Dehalogenimonas sp. WBC-2]|nr:hypothetical protein DGWBC_1237 [Dehalogenimonas sp. WBC-2]